MSVALYIPPYAANADYASQEYYQELLNTILTLWFNPNGFAQPILTNSQVAIILAAGTMPIGTHWFNSDIDAEQFLGNSGVQTVTSSY